MVNNTTQVSGVSAVSGAKQPSSFSPSPPHTDPTAMSPPQQSAAAAAAAAASAAAATTTSPLSGVGGGASSTAVAITDDPVERTAIGIPVRLLWVPYITFTLVILVLIMASFCKFHRKHGHKYRRRRMEIFQQTHAAQLAGGAGGGGGSGAAGAPGGAGPGGGSSGGTSGGGLLTQLPPNGGAPCNADILSGAHARDTNPNSSSSTMKKKSKVRRKQRPLTFMRNANGSMVDLRCGERNSMNIFKTPFSTHAESSIWTLPRHGGAYRTLNSPPANYFSDDDGDDVLLIHSTKL